MKKLVTTFLTLPLLFILITTVSHAENEPQNNKYRTADSTAIPASLQYHISNNGDVDIIKVHCATGGMLTVQVTNVPNNIQMQIWAINRRDTLNNFGNATGGTGADTKLEVDVPAGDYYIYLNDQNNDANSSNAFTVNIALDNSDAGEWNNFFKVPYTIAENDTFQARIAGFNNSIPIHNDRDYYKVHATAGGTMTINVTNVPSNIQIQIWFYKAGDSSLVLGNTTAGSGAPAKLEVNVPAGDYEFLIMDQNDDALNDLFSTVQVNNDHSDAGEWDNFFKAAYPVAENDTFQARIAGVNNSIQIHNDRDYYKYHASAGGLLNINVTNVPNNIQAQIWVYKASDSTFYIANATAGTGQNANLEVVIPAGDYVILVMDQNDDALNDQFFTVQLNNDHSDAAEFNNYFAEAYTIPQNDSFPAAIRGYNRAIGGHNNDREFYKVNATSDGLLVVKVTNVPNNIQMEIVVYKSTDSVNYLNYSTAGTGQDGLLEVLVPKGSYVIQLLDVNEDALNDNAFKVNVNLDLSDGCEINQYFAHPCTVLENDTFPASIRGHNETFTPKNDMDYYRVNTTTGGLLRITVPNVPGNIQMQIVCYNANDSINYLGYVNGGTGQPVTLEINVAGGRSYIFLIHDINDDGLNDNLYTVQVSLDHSDGCEFNNYFSYACTVLENDTLPASIRGSNRSITHTNDQDYYKIHVTRGGVLLVGVVNVPANLQLQILGYTAKDTINNIGYVNGGSGQSIRLSAVVPAGDYYILIHDINDDGQSPTLYSVQVALDVEDDGEWNNFFSKATTLTSLNDTFSAKIRGVYTRIPVADDRDYYRFHATQCGNLKIAISNVPPNQQMQILAFHANDTINYITYSNGGTGQDVSLTLPVIIGDYYLRLNDINDDALSANAFAVALSFANTGPAIPVITPTSSTTICQGDSIYLISNSPTNNHWTTGNKNNFIIAHNAGNYVDTVMGSPGCWSVSAPTTISYAPLPAALFGSSQVSNTEYAFTDSSSNTTTWHWDFGDGSNSSDEQNPQHNFPGPGTYTVVLVSKNDCGSDTTEQVVHIISTGVGVVEGSSFYVSPNPCSTCEIIGVNNSADLIVTDIVGRTITSSFTKTSGGYLLDLNFNVTGILLVRNIRTGEVRKFVRE